METFHQESSLKEENANSVKKQQQKKPRVKI